MTLLYGSFLTSVSLTWGSSDGLGTQTRKKIANPKMQKVCIFSLKSNSKNRKPDPNPRILNPTFGNPTHH